MKTLLKIFFGLVVIVVVAAAGFVYTFDANKYKNEIARMAGSITGRQISIEGDMDISLYPWIGIKVNDMTIYNSPAFSNQPFATIGQFDVRIKLIPLLKKRLDIEKLVLHRLSANLERNAAGANNWAGLIGQSGSDDVGSGFGLAGFVIGGIDLKDSSLTWLDSETGKQYKISKLSLSTQAINHNQPLPVELKGFVESNQPRWMAAVNAKTKLYFNDDTAIFDARDLKLTAKALLPDSKMDSLKIAMVADSTINLQTQSAKLSNTRLGLLGLVIAGDLDIEDLFSVPRIHGPVKVKTFAAEKLAENIGLDIPQLANTRSLKNISLTALFKTDFNTVRLYNIAAVVDQSKVKGFVHVAGISQPVVRYELKVDTINLDDYRLAGNAADAGDLPIPLEFIRVAELEGVLDIETATVNNTKLNKISITSSIEGGIANAMPITLQVHEGEVTAELQLDARETPVVLLNADVSQVDAAASINPLLDTIAGEDAPVLAGRVDANIELNAKGSSMADFRSSARGTISTRIEKGTIKGIDFNYASQSVVVDYADRNDFRVSRTFNEEYVPGSTTEFNSMAATFKIANGKLVNNDLLMLSDQVKVTGAGSIDFISGKVDYRPVIDMNVKNTGNVRDKLRGHPMEYHAHGLLGGLTCEFNVEKYDLHLGRLMIQEAKAHRNKQINRQSQGAWTNVMSK